MNSTILSLFYIDIAISVCVGRIPADSTLNMIPPIVGNILYFMYLLKKLFLGVKIVTRGSGGSSRLFFGALFYPIFPI